MQGTHFFIKPIDTPLKGMKIVGWVHKNDLIIGRGELITQALKLIYKGCMVGNYSRLVTRNEVHEREEWYKGRTHQWHRDSGCKYSIMTVIEGPGTEFCSRNIMPELTYLESVPGKKYNFPNGYLLQVEHSKVVHRTPPWLRQNRMVYRWSVA